MNDTESAQLRMLVDREAIRDVILRYCHGADRSDEAVVQSVYWPGAWDDHGVFAGPAEDFIPFLLQSADGMDQMQHLVGNILIRVTGDTARVESYFNGYHRVRTEQGPHDMIAAGRYLDELERRDSEWRIVRRQVLFDWYRTLEGSADWSQGLNGAAVSMGGRAPEDGGSRMFADDALDRSAFKV